MKYQELKKLGILFVLIFIIFVVLFRKENFLVTLRTVLAIFYIFIIPGYFITLNMKLDFAERIVIGCAISAAIIGIVSYFLGLMGINLLYMFIFYPLIIIIYFSMELCINKRGN